MGFHNHQIYHDLARKIPDIESDSIKYYLEAARTVLGGPLLEYDTSVPVNVHATMEFVRTIGELEFIEEGRPYFRIHPDLIPMFSKSSMDDAPAKLVQFPFDKKAFSLQFPTPEEGNPFVVDEKHFLRSVLVHRCALSQIYGLAEKVNYTGKFYRKEAQAHIDNRLMFWFDIGERETKRLSVTTGYRTQKAPDNNLFDLIGGGYVDPLLKNLQRKKKKQPKKKNQFIRIPIAQNRDFQLPIYIYRQLGWADNETIEESFKTFPKEESGTMYGPMLSFEQVKQIVRLAITCCFLAQDEDPLIVPEVLSKNAQEARNCSKERLVRLQQIAKAKGRYGWRIGTDDMLRKSGVNPHSSSTTHEKGELLYSHIRDGHWHKVKYGPGKTLTKVKWYRQTRVRPDLPLKTED